MSKEPVEDAVLFYAGEFGYFMSNFSAFEVNHDGHVWKTSEHAYQAAKFAKDSPVYKEILAATSAHNALKIAGRNGEHKRSDWSEAEKIRVMTEVVRAKHDQHEYIQLKLQETGNAELIENAPRDPFWGRGPDWKGRNELGKIWMKLREEMR
ncbi:MAG: NADAR family protein [Methyloligellaceae bacterium]